MSVDTHQFTDPPVAVMVNVPDGPDRSRSRTDTSSDGDGTVWAGGGGGDTDGAAAGGVEGDGGLAVTAGCADATAADGLADGDQDGTGTAEPGNPASNRAAAGRDAT